MARTDARKARREPATSGDDSASFRALFAANPLPMWVYDLETLAFLEVNDAAVAKYGYRRVSMARAFLELVWSRGLAQRPNLLIGPLQEL